MRKILASVLTGLLAVSLFAPEVANASVKTVDTPLPPNAVVSEGNGTSVLIGWGMDKKIHLQWRPSKKYQYDTLLYQVKRSDGTMVESQTGANSFDDQNLVPNTPYTYSLTSYRVLKKNVMVKGAVVTKTYLKRLGRNILTVTTLPSQVVALQISGRTSSSISVVWQPPQFTASPVKYRVYLNGNIYAYDLQDLSYTFTGLQAKTGYSIKVEVVNVSGSDPDPADIGSSTTA